MPSGMGGRAPLFGDAEIISTAIKIKADGGEVTPYTVMHRLGGGSVPYFKKALKRLIRDNKIQSDAAVGEFDDVVGSIIEMLESTKNNLRLKAHNEYKSQRAQYESANEGLRAELGEQANNLTELSSKVSSLTGELTLKLNELDHLKNTCAQLQLDLATSHERTKNLNEALKKEETKSAENLDRLHQAHVQFQSERRELLDRINNISVASRSELESARQAERSMRDQLRAALKDGIEHTTAISRLREENKILLGGKNLLKKHGNWETISTLCAAASKKTSRKQIDSGSK